MTYELWDEASGNRVEGFDQVAHLAEIVRQIAEVQGIAAVDHLFVEVWADYDDSEPVRILRGDELRRFVPPLVTTHALEQARRVLVPVRTTTSPSTLTLAAHF
jgi:hypothetical protein